MTAPLVSVGLPVFDGARYLGAALDALRGQTHGDLEIIVCDNASTDGSLDVARAAAAEDPRVVVHPSERNRGASWNFNRAVALARGRLFTWAASDDLRAPTAVARCVEALEAGGPGTVLAHPDTLAIDGDGAEVGFFDDGLDLDGPDPVARLRTLLEDAREYHPVFGLVRTDVLRTTGLIGSFVASDVVLLAELALRGRWAHVGEPLFLRRFHDRTSVNANPGAAERAAWFDPGRRGGARMPCTRVGVELLRAVARSPLPAGERARAAAAVVDSWYVPRWRTVGGEAKQVARATVRPVAHLARRP